MLGKNLKSLWVETDPDKAIARSRKLLEKGRSDAAVSALKDAIEAAGEEPRIRIELSQLLVAAGRVREAAEGLRSFLKSFPDDYRRAAEFADWARAQRAEIQPVHEVIAEHLVSRRAFGPAFEAIERISKEGLHSLLDARLSNLNRFVEKSAGTVPKSALPHLYFAALVHEALGDMPKAADAYRRIVAASPQELNAVADRMNGIVARHFRSAALRTALAEIYLGAGSAEKACEEYAKLAEADPKAAPQAAEALEAIAGKASDPAPALWALARVRRREGKAEELLEAARRLIAREGHEADLVGLLEGAAADGLQDPRIDLLIGEAAIKAGKIPRASAALATAAAHPLPAIREQAKEALRRLIESNPSEARGAQALADLLLKDGSLDECVAILDRLVAADATAIPFAVSRLDTLLISSPGHPAAEALLERVSTSLSETGLAAAFLRRKMRASAEGARAALAEVTPLLAANPRDPAVRLAAAEARAVAGDMAAAWEMVRDLLDGTTGIDPDLFHLLVLIGGSSPALCHQVSDSLRTMAPALASAPEGLFALGEMAARSGDMMTALESLRAAGAFSPAAATAAIEALRSFGGQGLSGETAVGLTEALLDAGDLSGAAAILSSATSLPPSASRVLTRLEEALRAHPEDADLRVALASAMTASGRAEKGRQIVETGIRTAGDSAAPSLHLAAGEAWLREGNLGEAVRSFSRAMAKDKTLASETARRLEKVLAVDVGHPLAHISIGRARLLDGQAREGVNSLLTAWSIKPSLGVNVLKDLAYAAHAFPHEPQVDLARAQILLAQGQSEEASDALGSALKTAPSMVGEVLVRLDAMTRSHPLCGRAQLHLGRAWRIKGRCAEASAAYASAAEIDSKLSEPAASGLADLSREFPHRHEPLGARARLCEAQGNLVTAADLHVAAIVKGGSVQEALGALRRIAARPGPHRGKALFALAGAARAAGRPDESSSALEEAARAAPELLEAIRREAGALADAHPGTAAPLRARAWIAMTALDPAGALSDAEALLETDPAQWEDAERIASAAERAGGDPARCGWLCARALAAGAKFDEASRKLRDLSTKADGDTRVRMLLLLARLERRRGDGAAAMACLREAESLAGDREAFLSRLHAETLAATRGAATRGAAARSAASSGAVNGERWRALRACLDLGDASGAERIAADLGLGAGSPGTGSPRGEAAEALSRIACLRGRFDQAADLLAAEPASTLKAWALRRSGRLVEAAVCVAEMSSPGSLPAVSSREIYRRLAAMDLLGEPASLQAETILDFGARDRAQGEAS